MYTTRAQELVRELITETDHLSREWHAADQQTRSARLEALRSTLQRIERSLGSGDARRSAINGELDVVYQRLRDIASGMGETSGRGAMNRLMEHADHLRHESVELLGTGVRLRTLPEEGEADVHGEVTLKVGLTVAAVVALAVPLLVPALRRSPLAWGLSASLASVALGALLLPERARERVVLAGRDAVAILHIPASDAFPAE